MMTSAQFEYLFEQRRWAIDLLQQLEERIIEKTGSNALIEATTAELRTRIQQEKMRLRDWCPSLFGPEVPRFEERCRCELCQWEQPR